MYCSMPKHDNSNIEGQLVMSFSRFLLQHFSGYVYSWLNIECYCTFCQLCLILRKKERKSKRMWSTLWVTQDKAGWGLMQ